jgi:hypothetical protein
MNKNKALINVNLTLNTQAFKFLINAISIKAIKLIKKEWITLHELVQEARTTDFNLGPYDY